MLALFYCRKEVIQISEQLMKQYVGGKTEKKFYGHDKLYSKYIPRGPKSPEREYMRAVNAYMKILKEVMESELPGTKQAYMEEMHRADSLHLRFDSFGSLNTIINRTFERMELMIEEKEKSYGLRKILQDLADMNGKLSIREWKKTLKATLGIDIMEDYYLGEFFRKATGDWVGENVDLIKTIPKNTLGKMKQLTLESYESGVPSTELMKQIQKEYGTEKKHARMIARDQTAKLNSQIAQAQQLDAGIEEYIWYCVNDARSRKRHKELHGKTFKWSEPPEVAPGRNCHPGEDYQCRCIARPVFKRNSISVPVKEG